MEYVSLAKSRAGYQPSETPKKKAKPSHETSVTPAAKTNHDGGESASHKEEV